MLPVRPLRLAGCAVLLLAVCGVAGASASNGSDRGHRVTHTSLELVLVGHAVRAVAPGTSVGARTASAPATPNGPYVPVAGAAARRGLGFAAAVSSLAVRGEIPTATATADVSAWGAARTAIRHLRGVRKAELSSVARTLTTIARGGSLTPARLPQLVLTLQTNTQWWTSGPLLSYGQRVGFPGSNLVWEYYPGQGIQLQVLGSFGKADGLYTGGPADYPALEQLLSEIIPLASQRGGGLTWEYFFTFDGGAPPWTSAMSQATGLEALTRAYQATGDAEYLNVATQALPVFSVSPPAGVNVKTALGTRFLQYTFAPNTAIINAFLQTLIGLYDFAKASGNQTAAGLFVAGNAEAQAEVPAYNTGAWSEYQPGIEDTLSYHELVTGFLAQLCTRTAAPVYCTTAQAFQDDLTTPPVLAQLTLRARTRAGFGLRFRLSKNSHVGVTITQGSKTVFATSANFPYGIDSVAIPRIRQAGTYGVTLAGTDLAGNFARITGTLTVSR